MQCVKFLPLCFIDYNGKICYTISMGHKNNFKLGLVSLILILIVGIMFSSCKKGETSKGKKVNLVVFAAASLTEGFNEIKTLYEKENQNVNIVYNFDSSGTLRTQILNGADVDVFVSAGQKQMDDIDKSKSQNDYILDGSRIDYLENKVVLSVPDDNRKNITSFDDLISKLNRGEILLSIGNTDVPVGGYTKKIMDYYKVDIPTLERNASISYASNVKEVTTQVKEGIVDAGIIYETDAKSANLKIVDSATKEMCGQVIYPLCILKNSKNITEAEKFVEYLRSSVSKDILAKIGFTVI